MTPEQFCYWLQGFLELSRQSGIDEMQTQIVKDHLKLVFKKETPDRQPFTVTREAVIERLPKSAGTGGVRKVDTQTYCQVDPFDFEKDTTPICVEKNDVLAQCQHCGHFREMNHVCKSHRCEPVKIGFGTGPNISCSRNF